MPLTATPGWAGSSIRASGWLTSAITVTAAEGGIASTRTAMAGSADSSPART